MTRILRLLVTAALLALAAISSGSGLLHVPAVLAGPLDPYIKVCAHGSDSPNDGSGVTLSLTNGCYETNNIDNEYYVSGPSCSVTNAYGYQVGWSDHYYVNSTHMVFRCHFTVYFSGGGNKDYTEYTDAYVNGTWTHHWSSP